MITILGRRTSINVQAVIWLLNEMGLTHAREDYGIGFGGTDTPAYRAMNPMGLVPVLKDGDLTMFESQAILRYLAAEYGDCDAVAAKSESPRTRGSVDGMGQDDHCPGRDLQGVLATSSHPAC